MISFASLKKCEDFTGGGGGKSLPCIFYGNSYGGYLALLSAKIAPWHIDAVVENGAEALPMLHCIIAKDLGKAEFEVKYEKLLLKCTSYQLFSRNPQSPYYFSDDCYLIRSLLNPLHLKIWYEANPSTLIKSHHAKDDTQASCTDKIILIKTMQELGFKIGFETYFGEHCELNDTLLLEKLSEILEKLSQGERKISPNNEISYPCKDKIYRFKDEDEAYTCEILNK